MSVRVGSLLNLYAIELQHSDEHSNKKTDTLK
jgi:hypothetical protein